MSNQHNLLLPRILEGVAVFQLNTFIQAALKGKYHRVAQNGM